MRIALLGSAPSSVELAPYGVEDWVIWACSPGAYPSVKRVEAWFELHRWEPDKPWFSPEYVAFMAGLECLVYMIEPRPEIPTSAAYPKEEMLAEFGRNFFTSSLSWMLALAISKKPVEIGLWGVDMSATEEYAGQRAGCRHFIELARSRGIKVTIPPESDLDRPYPLYGLGEVNPMRIKLMVRKAELEGKMATAAKKGEELKMAWEQAIRETLYFQGAMEDVQYMLNTWVE